MINPVSIYISPTFSQVAFPIGGSLQSLPKGKNEEIGRKREKKMMGEKAGR